MCTLTVLPSAEGSIITMNRDERRERHEPGVLFTDVTRVFPRDGLSQGTWFGMNRGGVVLALLNRYQQPHAAGRQSRGVLIPDALNAASAVMWLSGLDPRPYNPFDLFCVFRQQVWHFQWNGRESPEGYVRREVAVNRGFMFSSSSFMAHEVLTYRRALFERWLASHDSGGHHLASSVLNGFHLHREPGMATHAVLMEREHSMTRSVCQVVLGEARLTLDYYPEVVAAGVTGRITTSLSR